MGLSPEQWSAAIDSLIAGAKAAKTPPNKAPYKILARGNKFVVVNNGNEVKATFDSHAKALDYLKALYANVPGAAAKSKKKQWTGKAKRAS